MNSKKFSSIVCSLATVLAAGLLGAGCNPGKSTVFIPTATGQSNTVATLNVAVNPNPLADASFSKGVAFFQYGILPGTPLPLQQRQNIYPNSTPTVDVGTANAVTNVASQVTNLTPGVIYYASAVAEMLTTNGSKIETRGPKELLFGSPAMALNGAANVTNNVGTPFTDPGATATFGLRAIAGGSFHSLALKSDGTVVGWGLDDLGQASGGNGFSNVVAIAAGRNHSLALKADGTVASWGRYGQTTVPPGLINVVAIAAGENHSLALKADGTVVGWGDNTYGKAQGGNGFSNVVAIAAGRNHSLALKADGTVVGWGDNGKGQALGGNGLNNVVAIAAGGEQSVALKSDGTVVGWGTTSANGSGVTNAVAISAGLGHSLVLKADGTVVDLGVFFSESAGAALAAAPASLSNVVAIAASDNHSLALKSDGTVEAWGINTSGQATSQADLKLLPVQVSGSVNPNAAGTYTLTYSATNALGGKSATLTRTVTYISTNGTPTNTLVFPVAVTAVPAGLSNTVATLGGAVNPNGQATTGRLLWGKIPGTARALQQVGNIYPSNSAPASVGNGSTLVTLTSNLVTGLTPGVVYHANVLASNSVGVTWGRDLPFGSPALALNGAANVTNTVGSPFTDPGATASNSPVAIAGGGYHSLALKADGTVVGWGWNAQLETTVPMVASNAVAIAGSFYWSAALKADGTVVGWGRNSEGQTNVPVGLSNVVAIAGGFYHGLALKSDGTVVGWGSGSATNVPVGLNNVVAIVGAGTNSLALKSDGTVVGWGGNYYGQTNVPASLSNVVAIAGGNKHSLALKSDGTVVGWGIGSATNVPVGLNNVVAIAAGDTHSLALKSDGTIEGWGDNAFGQALGGNGLSNVVAIAGGGYHSLALKSDGAVVGWGNNTYTQTNASAGLNLLPVQVSGSVNTGVAGTYQLTYSATNNFGGKSATLTRTVTVIATNAPPAPLVAKIAAGSYHSLFLRTNGTMLAWGWNNVGQTNVPVGLSNLVGIAAGSGYSAALKSNGTVVVWGDNFFGQTNVPVGLSNVVTLASGQSHLLALKSDGTVASWGSVANGQTDVPVGLNNVKAIASGGGSSHSLVVLSNGTIVVWGNNSSGQTNVPAGLNNVVGGAAGGFHSLAVKADGSVVGWGGGSYGQTNVPAGLSGVSAVAAGYEFSLALKSDGTVVAWGRNNYGQTNVPVGLNNVVAIAAGYEHCLALKANGKVVAWGSHDDGETNVPVELQGPVNGFAPSDLAGGDGSSGASGKDNKTPPNNAFGDAPVVTSLAATSQSNTVATLNGTANPNGLACAAWFEWGVRSNAYTSRSVNVSVGNGSVAVAFSNVLTGLTPGVLYHGRAGASNSTGVSYGANVWFGSPAIALNGGASVTNVEGTAFFETGVTTRNGLLRLVAGPTAAHNLAVKGNGAVASWGFNYFGQGNVPGGLFNVPGLAGGALHSVALKADGTVAAWNYNGDLFGAFTGQATVPGGLSNVVAVAGGYVHTLALKADGTVVAWGGNSGVFGGFGGQTNVPAGLSNVVAVAAGGCHSLALRSTGTVVAWGSNIGYTNNLAGQTNVPASVTNVVAVAGGGYHSLALRANGTVVAWGDNGFGQANVPASATNVVAIATGIFHNLALRSNGTVVAWGGNAYGQTNVPAGLTNIVAIAAGSAHSVAMQADGTLFGWGDNTHGEIEPSGLAAAASVGYTVTGTARTNIGTYTLTYTATNLYGGVNSLTRTVVNTPDAWAYARRQLPTDAVAWWQAENNGVDSIGGNTASAFGSAGYTAGQVGQAFSINNFANRFSMATSSGVDLGAFTGGFSIEFWVNPSANVDQPYLEWHNGSTEGLHLWNYAGTGRLYANLKTASGDNIFQSATGLIATNTWQHIALTYDRSTGAATLYYNGVSVATTNVGNIAVLTGPAYSLHLASRNGWSSSPCKLDEVTFYKRALSSNEVGNIYSVWSLGKTFPTPTLRANAVAWWQAESNVNDSVGTSQAVWIGTSNYVAGKVGQGFSVSAPTRYVRAAGNSSLNLGASPSGFTVECWVNPNADVDQPILEWNNNSLPGLQLWRYAGSGVLWANLLDVGGTDHQLQSGTGTLIPGVWQHVALTYDRTNGVARLYRNGAQVATATVGNFAVQTGPSYNLNFGYRPAPAPYSFAGSLDEVTLYTRPLSATEISGVWLAGGNGKAVTPRLAIAPGGGNVTLNWASPRNPAILESITALGGTNTWQPLSGDVTANNGTNSLVVPADLFFSEEAQRFFRLRGY